MHAWNTNLIQTVKKKKSGLLLWWYNTNEPQVQQYFDIAQYSRTETYWIAEMYTNNNIDQSAKIGDVAKS